MQQTASDNFWYFFPVHISNKHQYNTRQASRSNFYLPKIRTNFVKYNIWFVGGKVWGEIAKNDKLMTRNKLKRKLIADKLATY